MILHIWFREGFPGDTVVKNLPANVRGTRNIGSIRGSGRSPGGGNPLQYSSWEESMGIGDCPWGQQESDMTEHVYAPHLSGSLECRLGEACANWWGESFQSQHAATLISRIIFPQMDLVWLQKTPISERVLLMLLYSFTDTDAMTEKLEHQLK